MVSAVINRSCWVNPFIMTGYFFFEVFAAAPALHIDPGMLKLAWYADIETN